jgi:hypothetical protein
VPINKLAVTCLALSVSACSSANDDWGIDKPWSDSDVKAPKIEPYKLPTLQDNQVDFKDDIPALRPAPKVNPDDIFNAVLSCYPEKSKFKIDLGLVAGMRSTLDEYDSDSWPSISEHYVGIVAKMPIYSASEQSRERQWEYQRRTATAQSVATFTKALADRNYAYRLMGLYLSLEARSQVRVQQGVASVDEQVGLLEKVAQAQRDVVTQESILVQQRLSLVALCEDSHADEINQYLEKLLVLPTPAKKIANDESTTAQVSNP